MSSFTETILAWYDACGRDLPWRRTRDPYAIWLSEIILQQTRIAQGRAYWERFMAAFPSVEALSAASEDEVLRLWQGLGYYSRARNLHAAARQIVALGHFPDTLEGIRALKGVGDYTAAAIGSIAFGLPAAVVDGNVYRVLARHFGIATPVGSTAARKEFTALAQSLLPPDRPGDFNQGMMDFGALQCTPAAPACLLCPLAASCAALAAGATVELCGNGARCVAAHRQACREADERTVALATVAAELEQRRIQVLVHVGMRAVRDVRVHEVAHARGIAIEILFEILGLCARCNQLAEIDHHAIAPEPLVKTVGSHDTSTA